MKRWPYTTAALVLVVLSIAAIAVQHRPTDEETCVAMVIRQQERRDAASLSYHVRPAALREINEIIARNACLLNPWRTLDPDAPSLSSKLP